MIRLSYVPVNVGGEGVDTKNAMKRVFGRPTTGLDEK